MGKQNNDSRFLFSAKWWCTIKNIVNILWKSKIIHSLLARLKEVNKKNVTMRCFGTWMLVSLLCIAGGAALSTLQAVSCSEGASSSCLRGKCLFENCESAVDCAGGGCEFRSCVHPSCSGGKCVFKSCSFPTCHGGRCAFFDTASPIRDGFCNGQGCSIEGEEAESHMVYNYAWWTIMMMQ